MHKLLQFLGLNIYVIHVLLWIKYWSMWFEIVLVFILFKFKKGPDISGIGVVFLSQFKMQKQVKYAVSKLFSLKSANTAAVY